MNIVTANEPVKLAEEEKAAIQQIKRWVYMLCRNKCTVAKQIYVSPYVYFNKGERIEKTIICISENLPDGPVVQIHKPLLDISIEDLLSCYGLINYCGEKKEK